YKEVLKLQKLTEYSSKTLYRWIAQLTENDNRTATSKELAEAFNNTYLSLNITSKMV
ncbi:15212_t:CDS:2, partial [Cetraspora pellucida]